MTFHVLAEHLEAQGFDTQALLQRFSITMADLARAGGVSPEVGRSFADAAANLCGDPYVGLHVAQAAPPGSWGLLEYLVRSSPTLGEAIERAAYYRQRLRGANDVRSFKTERECVIELLPAGGPPGFGRHYNETYVYAALRATSARASRVFFANEPYRDLHPLVEAFGTQEIAFSAPTSGFAMALSELDKPMPETNPTLLRMLEHHASLLETPLADTDFVARVRRCVRERLPQGEADLVTVARSLRIGGRTLQRRLQSTGSSFERELGAVRRELALQHLADPNIGFQEVAFRLGFSQPNAFWRAFRRWTGMTPAQHRDRVLVAARTITVPSRPPRPPTPRAGYPETGSRPQRAKEIPSQTASKSPSGPRGPSTKTHS
jgi:AraC-like DNA-binding protein